MITPAETRLFYLTITDFYCVNETAAGPDDAAPSPL